MSAEMLDGYAGVIAATKKLFIAALSVQETLALADASIEAWCVLPILRMAVTAISITIIGEQ